MAGNLIRRGTTTGGLFDLEVGETDAGSVRVRFRPRRPLRSFYGRERQVAAFVYALAAELEQRADRERVRWAISPDPANARLDIEIVEEHEFPAAQEFLMEALVDLGLDTLVVR
jgi:hypothetical protein